MPSQVMSSVVISFFYVNDAGDAAYLEAMSPSRISILGGVFESTHPSHIGPLGFELALRRGSEDALG